MKSIHSILLAIALSQAMSGQGTKTVVLDNTDPRPLGCVPVYSTTKKVFVCTVISATGTLGGDVTGTIASNVVAMVGGKSAAAIAAAVDALGSPTSDNTAGQIVRRDSLGAFSAGLITASLYGNAATATLSSTTTKFELIPELCDVGQSPRGVDEFGDAVGCIVVGVGSSVPGQVLINTLGSIAGASTSGTGLVVLNDSPTLAGNPTVPSQSGLSNSTVIANTATTQLIITNRLSTLTTAFNAGAAASTVPARLVTTLPAACGLGDVVFKTDATPGRNLHFCTGINTWTQQAGGAGSVAFADLTGSATDAQVPDNITIGVSAAMPGGQAAGDWWDTLQLVVADPAAGTAGLRTLGTGPLQAAAGNDSRLSDARNPLSNSVGTTALQDGAVTPSKMSGIVTNILTNTAEVVTTGTTFTPANRTRRVFIDPATAMSSLSITLPATPVDGDQCLLLFGGSVTSGQTVVEALAINANSGQVLEQFSAPVLAVSGDVVQYEYRSDIAVWYRVQ